MTLAFSISIVAALHVALWVAWTFSILPGLERSRFSGQLDQRQIESFPTPDAGWLALELGGLRLRVPLLELVEHARSRCESLCQLELDVGRLTIFPAVPAGSSSRKIVDLAPTRNDVSFFHNPWRNWQTIESLAARIGLPNRLPPTERFTAPHSQGVITYFDSNQVKRWVIHAFARDGDASRKLALSGASRETLHALLGSLEFHDRE